MSKSTKVFYEWTVEEIDEHGDIVDNHFYDKFPGMPEAGIDVGLVQDIRTTKPRFDRWGNEIPAGELVSRQWAYIKDGKLPEAFESGESVPKKFHKEMGA